MRRRGLDAKGTTRRLRGGGERHAAVMSFAATHPPTWIFTAFLRWCVPHTFARRSRTYQAYPQVTCVAGWPCGRTRTHARFRFSASHHEPGLRWDEVYSAWASTEREHPETLRRRLPVFDRLITSQSVPATTRAPLFRRTS